MLGFVGTLDGVRGPAVGFMVFGRPLGLDAGTMDEPLAGMVVDLLVLANAETLVRIRLADSGPEAIRKSAKSLIHILKSFCLL